MSYSIEEQKAYLEKILNQCKGRGWISVEDLMQVWERCPNYINSLVEYIYDIAQLYPNGGIKAAKMILECAHIDVSWYKIPE